MNALPSLLGKGIHLSSQNILIGRIPAGVSRNLLLRLEDNSRALAASQADESAHLATLLFKRRLGPPVDRAGVLSRPGRRRTLVVELSEGLELSVGEEPELQHGPREVRVYSTGGELDKRR